MDGFDTAHFKHFACSGLAEPTGFEPVISALTGQCVHQATPRLR